MLCYVLCGYIQKKEDGLQGRKSLKKRTSYLLAARVVLILSRNDR